MKRVVKAPGACCNVLIFLLLALLVTCAPARAADYVVTKDGTDADDNITCTEGGVAGSAYNTLKALVEGVNPGDTVTINAGEYTLQSGTYTVKTTLTRVDLDKLVEIKGHIAGDQWITQAFTVKQSGAVLPTPTPTPDPAGPSDPTPTPTPEPTPADPTTPDSGGSSGGSGGGCQAMGFAQGLLALAAVALLKRK